MDVFLWLWRIGWMYTSFACFALAGVFANLSVPGEPWLLKDYGLARQQGVRANKPLVVLIGSGKQGWKQVSQDGQLDKDIRRVLSKNYVCLYVDTTQEAGKALAEAFDVGDGPGVVIS